MPRIQLYIISMSASSSDSGSESDDEAQAALELQTLETKLSTRSSKAAGQVSIKTIGRPICFSKSKNSIVGADWRKHFPATVIQVRRTELSRRRPPREDYSRGDNETRVSKIRIWVFMSTEKSKKKRIQQSPYISDSRAFPIEIIELKVSYVGEKIALVSLKCRKRRDTMVKICEVFESLKLNVVTAKITAFPETLFKTLFIQTKVSDADLASNSTTLSSQLKGSPAIEDFYHCFLNHYQQSNTFIEQVRICCR
uniref:Plant bHLH transcription factor ACT-like domain-containing protein n=1 Tax=Lactuca sativa TaxID=4236 RepID=A0A9R1WNZ1_LACSA|nr:hypothetical protein LSAT_V11C100027830 [Lactuca sativa]